MEYTIKQLENMGFRVNGRELYVMGTWAQDDLGHGDDRGIIDMYVEYMFDAEPNDAGNLEIEDDDFAAEARVPVREPP